MAAQVVQAVHQLKTRFRAWGQRHLHRRGLRVAGRVLALPRRVRSVAPVPPGFARPGGVIRPGGQPRLPTAEPKNHRLPPFQVQAQSGSQVLMLAPVWPQEQRAAQAQLAAQERSAAQTLPSGGRWARAWAPHWRQMGLAPRQHWGVHGPLARTQLRVQVQLRPRWRQFPYFPYFPYCWTLATAQPGCQPVSVFFFLPFCQRQHPCSQKPLA